MTLNSPISLSLNCAAPRSAYIHIPFCRRRCYYCDFPITVVGDRADTDRSSLVTEYVAALCQEISLATNWQLPLETIFFGGGTPSLLPIRYLEQILQTLADTIGIASDAEISVEMDPGTFTQDKLRGYIDAGVNRVSLGIQTFTENLLQICGRSHSVKDIWQALESIERVGVANFSLDLISGLPHQTIAQWQSSLETAIDIAPPHISCYDLVLEPVTAFGKKYQPGAKPLPEDRETAAMYQMAVSMLTSAGYEHYEISNYARSGYQCRHNRVYWENRPYYGFGMGAASYVEGIRFTRPRTRREYYNWLHQGAIADNTPNSARDLLLETLMLGLRLQSGVSLDSLQLIQLEQYPDILTELWKCLEKYYDRGWVEVVNEKGIAIEMSQREALPSCGSLKLTDPEGFLFSNTVLAALFHCFEE